jgi:hypothetical protein
VLRQLLLIREQDGSPSSAGCDKMLHSATKTTKHWILRRYNSRQVLFRFFFRLVLLGTFATFGTRGFAAAFAGLLALSAIFCAVTGAMRREAIFGPELTHWDEAVAYAVVGYLIAALS